MHGAIVRAKCADFPGRKAHPHWDLILGIVSRADRLKTFTRSDASIRKGVVDEVIKKALTIDPRAVTVHVHDGVLDLRGELESKSLCNLLVRMVERVEGTVGVERALTYRLHDTRLGIELPARALPLSADER